MPGGEGQKLDQGGAARDVVIGETRRQTKVRRAARPAGHLAKAPAMDRKSSGWRGIAGEIGGLRHRRKNLRPFTLGGKKTVEKNIFSSALGFTGK